MSDTKLQKLRLNRQYVVGPRFREEFRGWKQVSAPGNLCLTHHPNLHIEGCEGPNAKILCLGDIYDPASPADKNADVVRRIARDTLSFDDFESRTSGLSGRWIILASIGGTTRLYPDAAALRAAFYTVSDDELWVGSQPGLLAEFLGLRPNDGLIQRFLAHPHSTSWPGFISPYDGVFQLWPNHYLDLDLGSPTRFWPTSPVEALGLEECAATCAEYLTNSMRSIAQRGTVFFWLTGGYDSRVLFATSRPMHGQMNFCVFNYLTGASYDTSIARKLAKKSNRPIQVVRPGAPAEGFWQLLDMNTGRMAAEPGNITKTAFLDFPADSQHLTGTAGEVGRCFYYKDGTRPAKLDGNTLCDLSYYKGNPVAKEVFTAWLREVKESVPESFGIDPLDLFYWEHRLGAWLGTQCLVNDTFVNNVIPFNCRSLLATMLGADVEYRKEPYALFRKICEISYPEALDEPFNWSLRWQLEQQVLAVFPWRLRSWVMDLRSSWAGVKYR